RKGSAGLTNSSRRSGVNGNDGRIVQSRNPGGSGSAVQYNPLERGACRRRSRFAKGGRGFNPPVPKLLVSHLCVRSQARLFAGTSARSDASIFRQLPGKAARGKGRTRARPVPLLSDDLG